PTAPPLLRFCAMSALPVRTITEDDFPAFAEAGRIGFLQGPSSERSSESRRSSMVFDRAIVTEDGPRIVATARAFPTFLTIPGPGEIAAGAVTNVAVLPTHRRRGLLAEMMRIQLDDIAARGETVAILIASEHPIYGRFGYGPATEHATFDIDTRSAQIAPTAPRGGRIEFVDMNQLRELAPPVFDAQRHWQPGSILRSDRYWDLVTGLVPDDSEDDSKPWFAFIHRGEEDRMDGYVVFKAEE